MERLKVYATSWPARAKALTWCATGCGHLVPWFEDLCEWCRYHARINRRAALLGMMRRIDARRRLAYPVASTEPAYMSLEEFAQLMRPSVLTAEQFHAQFRALATTPAVQQGQPCEATHCPDGRHCATEEEWGHPCERDESGRYVCERARQIEADLQRGYL